MTWRADGILWLLFLVPLAAGLLWAAHRMRVRAQRKFGLDATVGALIRGRSTGLRATKALLWVFGLAFTVIALAGPRYGSRTRVVRRQGIDIVIALDFSKSMLARDVTPNRIERAKAELKSLLEEQQGSRVGIVAFAGETMEFPMTIDYSAIELFLRDLGPYDMPVGGTSIGRALIAGKRLLLRADAGADEGVSTGAPERERVIILFTDGEDHEGDPLEAATELANAGIRVYTVGIGSPTGEPIPTLAPDGTWTGYLRDSDGNVIQTALSPEGEATLGKIASTTGGKYFRAGKGAVGVDAIRREIARMKQTEKEAQKVVVHEERYVLALLPAFLLLFLEGLLPEAHFRRRRRA